VAKRTRRNYGVAFKAKVALEAIKGEETKSWSGKTVQGDK
jgi:hypothetical protein